MLQVGKQTTKTQLDDSERVLLRKQWKENRAIVLPKLIEPDLLKDLQRALDRGEFCKIKHSGVDATELTLKRDTTINLLEMMASEPVFSDQISQITGLKPLGYFQGRVYNISRSDHDDWHQDTGYDYHMAMSINLSPTPYQGGSLKLRDAKTKELFCDIHNTGPGDALIFDIDPGLEHKITPVTGKHPKIAFAGWFCPKPNYQDYMNKITRKVMKKSRFTTKAVDFNTPLEKKPPSINKSLAFRAVGKKTLLINLEDDSQCVFNSMGTKIWEGLCAGDPQEKIIATLQKTYKLDLETLKMEYQEFVERLLHIGYLNTNR